jgi:diguanylate cyclase (GGDEF)-like protein
LISGGMGTAAVAHFLLLRRVKLLGASIIGVALLGISGLHVLIGAVGGSAESEAVTPALLGMTVFILIAGLGQQLMAFEDMTYELQRTNRRLETAQQELRQMVITDPLTGTRNRRFFDEVIGRELRRHRRYNTPMSIVFIDVDRFKTINDTLGHATGDGVLVEYARRLLASVRATDTVARLAGDEFVVVLENLQAKEAAAAIARKIVDQIGGAPFELDGQRLRVTTSIGVAFHPADEAPATPSELLARADAALYRAKSAGRNTYGFFD